MSMTDPIADMLTRIRNAAAVGKPTVKMPSSRTKVAIAKVLQDEGYIGGSRVTENGAKAELEIELKSYEGRPVIERLQRISRSGLRQYRRNDALPPVLNGPGLALIPTSTGILTDPPAPQHGLGGTVPCFVATGRHQ